MITGLVLAAGTSSRLGRPKQLLDLGGTPMVRRVIDAARAAPLDEIVVVLGHAAREVRAAVPAMERVRFVENPDYLEGQSTSLRVGLHEADPASEALVVLLGDQPGVRPEAIRAVIERWRRGAEPIVQAAYSGRPGHPTLLAVPAWPEVEAVRGDQGARAIIERDRSRRALVEVGGAPPEDVDTEEDYRWARLGFLERQAAERFAPGEG